MSTPANPIGTGRGIFPGGFNPDPPPPSPWPAYTPVFDGTVTTINNGITQAIRETYCLTPDSAREFANLLAKLGVVVEQFLAYPLGLGRIASKKVPYFRTALGAEGNAASLACYFTHGFPLVYAWHATLWDLAKQDFEQCGGQDPGPFQG